MIEENVKAVGEVFEEEMRAEEDSTENGEDKVKIVGSKVKLRRCLTSRS